MYIINRMSLDFTGVEHFSPQALNPKPKTLLKGSEAEQGFSLFLKPG